MESVLLVIHFIVTLSLIGLVLLQKSEGGGLGIGGGGGGLGSLAGAHSTASFLTKATTIFAVLFFVSNLTLAYLAKTKTAPSTVFETLIDGEVAPVVDGEVIKTQKEELESEAQEQVVPSAPIAE